MSHTEQEADHSSNDEERRCMVCDKRIDQWISTAMSVSQDGQRNWLCSLWCLAKLEERQET